jgi:plasmid replication initiation protein
VNGHDEGNLASLVMLPSTPRLPEDMVRWEKKIVRPGGQPATLVVTAGRGLSLPRGSDNDVMVALINLYLDQGAPDDGWVSTTAYELLKSMNLANGGQQYQALRDALDRLHSTRFEITDGWYEAKKARYTTRSFMPLSSVIRTGSDPAGGKGLDGRSVLRIRLDDAITESIRAGYIKPLDMQLYQALEADASRALYRFLDVEFDRLRVLRGTQRPAPKSDAPLTYTALAEDLAANLGIVAARFDKVQQTLRRVNAELVAKGYLSDVTEAGRGRKMTMSYTLRLMPAAADPAPDPALVRLLLDAGIYSLPAERFVRALGEEVRDVIDRFRKAQAARPLTDPAAYLARMLTQAVKDLDAAPVTRPVGPSSAATPRRAPPEPLLVPPPTPETVLSGFRMAKLTRLGVSVEEQDALLGRARLGDVDLGALRALFTRMDMTADPAALTVALEELRGLLGPQD